MVVAVRIIVVIPMAIRAVVAMIRPPCTSRVLTVLQVPVKSLDTTIPPTQRPHILLKALVMVIVAMVPIASTIPPNITNITTVISSQLPLTLLKVTLGMNV